MSLWLTHPLLLPSLIVGVTIVLWATSLLPEFITALLFFTAAMTARIAPPEVIFGGFASSAFWLVFSGFVLGVAIRKTGLADRAARALSAKLTDSWVLMVASVVLLSYALAFVMPSNMGRIALLMPIVAAMAKRAGIPDGSRAWFGLALAVGFGTFQLSATILPANVPNLVMGGAAEGSYGIHLNYAPDLRQQHPEPGIVTGHEEGGVEQLVDFGKLVEFGGVADLPFHLPDDGSEGFHVRLGPERQGFGDARPFEDTRDDVAVVDFLSGHLPDVFALLRLRGDQPLLNEHLQRFPDGGSADPELFREDGLFDRSADFQRAFTDK